MLHIGFAAGSGCATELKEASAAVDKYWHASVQVYVHVHVSDHTPHAGLAVSVAVKFLVSAVGAAPGQAAALVPHDHNPSHPPLSLGHVAKSQPRLHPFLSPSHLPSSKT